MVARRQHASRSPPIAAKASTSSSCRSKNGVAAGTPVAVTTMAGDERWPSWTRRWPAGVRASRCATRGHGTAIPACSTTSISRRRCPGRRPGRRRMPLTETTDSETYPRVSPDGTKVAFVSERDSEDDLDLWWMPVPSAAIAQADPARRAPAEAGVVVGAVRRHRRQAAARQSHDARARQRSVSVVGAGQYAHRVLRRARRHRLGVGRDRRTAAPGADRGSDCRARSRPRSRNSCRAAAARRRGRPTARRCSSPACPIRSRSTTATRFATKSKRRRCSR